MSELTQKALTFLIRRDGESSTKVELYPAEAWAGRPGAEPGRFRVRVNRVWDQAAGKWTFRTMDSVLQLLRELSTAALGGGETEEPKPPRLPKGSRIRVPTGEIVGGEALYEWTFTSSEPFQGVDGGWWVFVVGKQEPSAIISDSLETSCDEF